MFTMIHDVVKSSDFETNSFVEICCLLLCCELIQFI